MIKVGFVGLGKLGLPVAVSLARHPEIRVVGYDVNPGVRKDVYPHVEAGPTVGSEDFQWWLKNSLLEFGSLEQAVDGANFIFLAVQTPHERQFEGITPLPLHRADFDYSYLRQAAQAITSCSKLAPETVVVIISTVLPGTIRREIIPLLADRCRVVYNPFFIAMGTVMRDFLNPEFILLGHATPGAADALEKFYCSYYRHFHFAGDELPPILTMSLESAELAKVAYNTFISLKIAYANTLMELCQKTGADVDSVTEAITLAKDRLISPAYLTAGMGDGGACHPRDNIAMSHLARKVDLSCDLFEVIMRARECQTDWLLSLVAPYVLRGLPCVVLGKAFKPETNIVTGSPALLCGCLLERRGIKYEIWDPYIDGTPDSFTPPPIGRPAVFLIATKHATFTEFNFPPGSVVIDPHRYIPEHSGVTVIWVGSEADESN